MSEEKHRSVYTEVIASIVRKAEMGLTSLSFSHAPGSAADIHIPKDAMPYVLQQLVQTFASHGVEFYWSKDGFLVDWTGIQP